MTTPDPTQSSGSSHAAPAAPRADGVRPDGIAQPDQPHDVNDTGAQQAPAESEQAAPPSAETGQPDPQPSQPASVDESFTVESVMPAPWPRHLRERLRPWKQGDLIERPGISWLGPTGTDEVTGLDDGEWEYEPVAAPELVAAYGVVASQTCDIGAEGPGAKHPFVEIHPVVNMSYLDAGRREQVEQFAVRYLVALTDPPAPGFWVADLRQVGSLSKGQLARCAALSGFASEADRLAFAEAMARKKRRPALHDVLSYDLPRALGDHIAELDRKNVSPDWYLGVEQIRLEITGDRLGSGTVSLVLICDTEQPADQRAHWRLVRRTISRLLRKQGFTLGAMTFTTPDLMTARHYRETVPLDVPGLPRPGFW